MPIIKSFFASIICLITLVYCNAQTGKEVARVTFTRLPDPQNPEFQYTVLNLSKGETIQFWSEMDLEYDDFQVIEFYVQLPADMNLPPIRLNALQKDITIGESRTVVGNHVSWRFTGRIGSFEAPVTGSYKFSTLLNPSTNPTLQLKKAVLVFKSEAVQNSGPSGSNAEKSQYPAGLSLVFKILLIAMPVVGLFILIKGIGMLMKSTNDKIITETPFSNKIKSFQIDKDGEYAIWHKGKLFQKAPADTFKPVITNELTGEKLKLFASVFRTSVNNGSTGRMELYTFSAPAGKFTLELVEGSSVSFLESALTSIIPVKNMDPDKYFIQVRENKPGYLLLFGILLSILGFGCLIGGIIFLFATLNG